MQTPISVCLSFFLSFFNNRQVSKRELERKKERTKCLKFVGYSEGQCQTPFAILSYQWIAKKLLYIFGTWKDKPFASRGNVQVKSEKKLWENCLNGELSQFQGLLDVTNICLPRHHFSFFSFFPTLNSLNAYSKAYLAYNFGCWMENKTQVHI